MIDRGVGRGCGAGGAARLDDRRSPFADVRQEVGLDPHLVVDDGRRLLATDLGVEQVGVHGRRMIAPYAHVRDVAHRRRDLRRELCDGAVVVEAHHRGEALARDVRGAGHRDQAVRVGWVADDQHLHPSGGALVQRAALDGEDLAVLAQQLGALHALGARGRADEQGDVDTVEGVVWIVVQVEPREQWKRAVDDLHRHALQRAHCGRYLQQPQVDRLVGAEQLPGGDAKYEAVTDLTGGAGDGYAYWLAHLFISFAGNNSIDRRARTRG